MGGSMGLHTKQVRSDIYPCTGIRHTLEMSLPHLEPMFSIHLFSTLTALAALPALRLKFKFYTPQIPTKCTGMEEAELINSRPVKSGAVWTNYVHLADPWGELPEKGGQWWLQLEIFHGRPYGRIWRDTRDSVSELPGKAESWIQSPAAKVTCTEIGFLAAGGWHPTY